MHLTLHWPQIVYLLLLTVGTGMSIAMHGRPKTGTHNGWASVIASALVAGLLYAGGFFG